LCLKNYWESALTIAADCIIKLIFSDGLLDVFLRLYIWKQYKIIYTWQTDFLFFSLHKLFCLKKLFFFYCKNTNEKFSSSLKWHSPKLIWVLTIINSNSCCLLLVWHLSKSHLHTFGLLWCIWAVLFKLESIFTSW